MTARDVFWTSTGSVRPLWRLIVFGAATVGSMAVVAGVLAPLVGGVFALIGVRVVVHPWMLLASGVLAHLVTFHLVEPRRWAAACLDMTALRVRPVAMGAALGALAVAAPSGALIGVGWLQVVPSAPGSSLVAAVSTAAYLAPAAFWEELMFRGYAFTVLAEVWGKAAALGATSLVFGLLHLQNAGATWPSIAVVVLAGVFLGGALIVTRSLYAAFAAHLAWNWTLVGVLHTPVSGIPFATPDYRVVDAGPDWATGGVWGPEGGVPAAIGLLSASIYLYARHKRREES